MLARVSAVEARWQELHAEWNARRDAERKADWEQFKLDNPGWKPKPEIDAEQRWKSAGRGSGM